MTYRECEICGASLDPGERCDCRNGQNLPAIRCTQPPVIAENLDNVRQNLEILLADISTLPSNDDALKYVKQIRANLAKEFDRLETQRKAVKRQVMEPYDLAEKKYKEYIADPYKAADQVLKDWVDGYQNGLKQKCLDNLQEYFDELCRAYGIDFLTFSRCGVVVDMAMARQKEPRKAMEQICNYVMSVRSDMDAILQMDDAEEIMAAYRNNPVLSAVVTAVDQQKKDKERMRVFVEEQRQQKELQAEARTALIAAAPDLHPEPEKEYSVCFRATGTITALKAMKAHALSMGITFEEIKQEDEHYE